MCRWKKVKKTTLEALDADQEFQTHLAKMEALNAQLFEELEELLEEDVQPFEAEFPNATAIENLTPAHGDSLVLSTLLFETESDTESDVSVPSLPSLQNQTDFDTVEAHSENESILSEDIVLQPAALGITPSYGDSDTSDSYSSDSESLIDTPHPYFLLPPRYFTKYF